MTVVCYLISLAGLFFMLTSVVGLMRFGNKYQILNIICINDMLGMPLFMLGMAGLAFFKFGNTQLAVKILLLIACVYICLSIPAFIIIKILYFVKKTKVND